MVDTGYRSNQIMETLGMRGLQFHENMIENQLARHGVRMGDVRYVLHTHLHIDHAGKDDLFPMNTTVGVNRRELEYSVSGLMHPQYPLPDIKHLIDRLHTKSALRFFDLEISGPVELMPGVRLEAAGAHTEGSMNVHVDTADGLATICGDVIYDFNDQIVDALPRDQRHGAAHDRQSRRLQARREGADQEAALERDAICCPCTTGRRRSSTASSSAACTIRCRGRWCSRCRSGTGSRRGARPEPGRIRLGAHGGAAKPGISSVEAVKRTLRSAQSFTYGVMAARWCGTLPRWGIAFG